MNYDSTVYSEPNLWAHATSGELSDELSTDGVTSFFDFEAWDGACLTTDNVIETAFAGINDDWDSSRCHGELHGPHQAEQQLALLDEPWIEPGLSPFADNLNIGLSTFDHALTMSSRHIAPYANTFDNIGSLERSADQNGMCPLHTVILEQEPAPQSPIISIPTHPQHRDSIANPLVAPQPAPNDVPKKKRARIGKAARKILNDHFRINPYPSEIETSALATTTQLQGRTIKTWFSNTRSRVKFVDGTSCHIDYVQCTN